MRKQQDATIQAGAGALFTIDASNGAGSRVAGNDHPPREIYPYADFERAAAALRGASSGGPFYALVLGASGTGKTSLLQHVAEGLDRHRAQAVYIIAQSGLRPVSLGRLLARAFHLGACRTHAETLRAIGQVIRELPYRIVLLLDEAQRLPAETMEDVRLLAESELGRGPLFSFVLAGPPELKERLDAPDLFGLKRRIKLRLELIGLRAEEALPFLVRRLGPSAAARLSPDALTLLFERSRGVPALLEDFATLALTQRPDAEKLGKDEATQALDAWEGI